MHNAHALELCPPAPSFIFFFADTYKSSRFTQRGLVLYPGFHSARGNQSGVNPVMRKHKHLKEQRQIGHLAKLPLVVAGARGNLNHIGAPGAAAANNADASRIMPQHSMEFTQPIAHDS